MLGRTWPLHKFKEFQIDTKGAKILASEITYEFQNTVWWAYVCLFYRADGETFWNLFSVDYYNVAYKKINIITISKIPDYSLSIMYFKSANESILAKSCSNLNCTDWKWMLLNYENIWCDILRPYNLIISHSQLSNIFCKRCYKDISQILDHTFSLDFHFVKFNIELFVNSWTS